MSFTVYVFSCFSDKVTAEHVIEVYILHVQIFISSMIDCMTYSSAKLIGNAHVMELLIIHCFGPEAVKISI